MAMVAGRPRAPAGVALRCWARRSAWLCAALAGPALAAPLDALLTATPEAMASRGQLELGLFRAVQAIDFSTTADDATQPPVSPTDGDYRGAYLRGELQLSEGLWLSGGLWQRRIASGPDTFRYTGWQLSGLYRFNTPAGAVPAIAMRLSGWGNQASATEITTPVHVPGAILNSVKVTEPGDQQLQADLIATWRVSPALDVTAHLGAGAIQLRYGALSATTTRNGCNYDLAFNGNDIFGTLAAPCNDTGGGVITQFYDRSGDYGVDVAREIAWGGRFLQAGLNARWRSGRWSLAGGYLLHSVRRDDVDAILARRGNPVYRQNQRIVLEAAYLAHPSWSPFVRLQVSNHLFFDEIPVTYNASTSGSFGGGISVATVGLRAGF